MTSRGWLTAPVIYPQVLPLPGRSWPRPPEKGKLDLGRSFLVFKIWKSSSSSSVNSLAPAAVEPLPLRPRVPVPPASPAGDLSSLCCKIPTQVGSSFFSFVNYLASLPGAAVFAWPRLSAVGWSHSRRLPPCPTRPLPLPLPPPRREAARPRNLGRLERQRPRVALRKRLQMGTRRRRAGWRLRRSGLPGRGWVAGSGDPPVCFWSEAQELCWKLVQSGTR